MLSFVLRRILPVEWHDYLGIVSEEAVLEKANREIHDLAEEILRNHDELAKINVRIHEAARTTPPHHSVRALLQDQVRVERVISSLENTVALMKDALAQRRVREHIVRINESIGRLLQFSDGEGARIRDSIAVVQDRVSDMYVASEAVRDASDETADSAEVQSRLDALLLRAPARAAPAPDLAERRRQLFVSNYSATKLPVACEK